MRGAVILIFRAVPQVLGESLQRRYRTAYALVFLAADSAIEDDGQSRCTGHVDNVHFDHPSSVASCFIYKTVSMRRLFPGSTKVVHSKAFSLQEAS